MEKLENSKWERISYDYIDDDNICHIKAWESIREEGKTIAWVDMLSGRVIYRDPEIQSDVAVTAVIQSVSEQAKKQHPYAADELEGILYDVVSYECEELVSGVDVQMNLFSMGFSEESMHFFGYPEDLSEEDAV